MLGKRVKSVAAAMVLGFGAATAQAADFTARFVLVTPAGSPQELPPGAVVNASAGIRLALTAEQAGTVMLSLVNGKTTGELMSAQPLAAATTAILPASGSFSLGTASGAVKLVVEFTPAGGAKQVQEVPLTVVSSTALSLGGDARLLSAPALPGKLAAALLREPAPKVQIASLDNLPSQALVQSVSIRGSADAEKSRGAVEVALFRNWAPGVVMISPGPGSLGSGAVIDKAQRHIITNAHVLDDKQVVSVVFKPATGTDADNAQVYQADVVRVDEVSDLALIRVREMPASVPQLKLGTLASVEVGADVHAIGHPTGELWSYTKGIVSQVRTNYEWQPNDGLQHRATVIQTQTPINPGNSGGPLLNDAGEILGINSFTRGDAQGINYAVSADDLRNLLALKTSRRAQGQRDSEQASLEGEGGKSGLLPPGKQGGKGAKPGKDATPGGGARGCGSDRTPFDADGDGKPDGYALDPDCNGRPNVVFLDSDGDGKVDVALGDHNQDGQPDYRIVDSDGNGSLDLWLIDQDGDGQVDVAGRDGNGDGEPETFRAVAYGAAAAPSE
ncbi:MAG: serine protease [Pseudomonadota bacterium]